MAGKLTSGSGGPSGALATRRPGGGARPGESAGGERGPGKAPPSRLRGGTSLRPSTPHPTPGGGSAV